jgi:hypothetical protein
VEVGDSGAYWGKGVKMDGKAVPFEDGLRLTVENGMAERPWASFKQIGIWKLLRGVFRIRIGVG